MQYLGLLDGELTRLREEAHLFRYEAATLCGVTIKTFKNWELSNRAPIVIIEFLKARAGCIWDGWHYRGGYLYDDVGRKFHQGTFLAAFYTLKAAEARNIEFINPDIRWLAKES